jgi:glutamate-ammonia-ligase adenylyltransferase
MRIKLQESATPTNLKRSAGGTMDTEFLVQMLQLRHGEHRPEIRQTGTLAGLTALEHAGHLPVEEAEFLRTAYRFQRSIEARIRLMDSAGRHEFPTDPKDRAKLAYLLGYREVKRLRREVEELFSEVRATFDRVFDRA